MTQNRFQTEPSPFERQSAGQLGGPLGSTAIVSMLLGLKLRGRLTDSEAQWLDMLAPNNWLTVLADGDEYLHPAGVSLLPPELITGDWRHQPNAVFSRRLSPGREFSNHWYRIHTAVIRQESDRPLVLGFFGPEETDSDQSVQECFFTVVELFRKASRQVDQSWAEIETMLAVADPTLLVNRNSGRVLAANPAVQTMMGDRSDGWVDSEYGEIRTLITGMSVGRSIRMRNFHAAGLDFCLVRWPMSDGLESPSDETDRQRLAEPDHCLTRIIRATQLLNDTEDLQLTPRQQGLLEEIFEAAHVLAGSSGIVDERLVMASPDKMRREV